MSPIPTETYFGKLMHWADEFRGSFGVRANADIPRDAKCSAALQEPRASDCAVRSPCSRRGPRIPYMQAMILARDEKSRRKALQALLPMQRKDFVGLFQAMDGYPVVIRTLDPPLHEFLPKREDLMVDLARLPHAGTPMKKEMSEKYRIPVGELKKRLPDAEAAWKSFTSSIPCWVTGAAASASPTPRSRRCKPAPFLKPRCWWPRRASR